MTRSGIVYLIHFDTPLVRGRLGNPNDGVRHYLGWTGGKLTDGLNSYDLIARMEEHLASRGASILAALNERGIGWRPVAAWDRQSSPPFPGFKATRDCERKLKKQRNTPRYCPVCRMEKRT